MPRRHATALLSAWLALLVAGAGGADQRDERAQWRPHGGEVCPAPGLCALPPTNPSILA